MHVCVIFILIISGALAVGSIPTPYACPIPSSSYLPGTVVIPVKSLSDINLRLSYNTTQHVTLEVQSDLPGANLYLNRSFSNTTLISKCGVGYTISTSTLSLIPLMVDRAVNFTIYAMNVSIAFTSASARNLSRYTDQYSPICNDTNTKRTLNWFARNRYFFGGIACPAILLSDTINTQVFGSSLYGSLALVNVSNTIIDGNYITTLDNDAGIFGSNMNNYNNLTFSPVTIRNNLLESTNGINLGILGVQNALGIRVVNNNVTNYRWSGLLTGTGTALNYFAYNFVHHTKDYPMTPDSPGIYIAAWRYGVNNTFKYNYMNLSGSHCFYNDYWSGGTIIDCNICAHGAFAYKLNMGWKVTISNFFAYDVGATFAAFCEIIQSTVCSYLKPPPPTKAWMDAAPWIFPMCSDSQINGIPCSTNDTLLAQSGNCSGLALLNSVDIAVVKSRSLDTFKLPHIPPGNVSHACGPYPIADVLNHYNATNYSPSNVYFDHNGLVRVAMNGSLAADMPCIANFPFDQLGVQGIIWTDAVGIILTSINTADPNSLANSPLINAASSSIGVVLGCVFGGILIVTIVVGAFIYHRKKQLSNEKRKAGSKQVLNAI